MSSSVVDRFAESHELTAACSRAPENSSEMIS